MSKKGFKSEFGPLLGHTTQNENTKNNNDKQNNTTNKVNAIDLANEDKDNEIRATFIVQESLLEKTKAIAYWDRLQIKEVVNQALSNYIAQWEIQNGAVKPIKK